MIELARHIEYLLLDNDCVIVPDLGGFIAHYQPARYDEVESLFIPPLRTIGFNPQLTMNDGLLIQSFMQAYHTDYSDATRIIAEKVKQLKEILYTEGILEITGIGTLNYTLYRTYEFSPKENGILTPSLYGLDCFQMSPLPLETVESPIHTEDIHPEEELPSGKTIRMIPKWLNHAAAIAIAVIMFFVLSVPVDNTYVDEGHYASLGTISLFDAIRSQSLATTLINNDVVTEQPQRVTEQYPKVVKVEKVAKAEEPVKVEEIIPVPEPAKVTQPQVVTKVNKTVNVQKKYFHIIVASLTTQSDAERMLRKYHQSGYTEATIVGNKERFRIALYSYGDKKIASKKLNELKQNDNFKSAWMFTSKK